MLSLVSLMPGCAPLKQYRTDYRPHPGSRTETNAIEETETNLLGFVEFDDHGWLWDANQMHAVVNRIAEEDKKQGLIILVLAHGWKHNASYQDANVASFRAVLADLQDVENKSSAQLPRPPRKVVGLYVGWRGLSQTLPVLKEFTFWERKRTAHAVGQGAVCELMAELDKLRKQSRIRQNELEQQHTNLADLRQPTLLILVGHSFGGAVTYSALAPYLQERLVDTLDQAGHETLPRGFGDLVVLINPAFEAARFQILKRSSDERSYGTNQAATLAILTSKADWATKIAFKIGRLVSTAFEKNRPDQDQFGANVTAVGHFRPYITHDLNAKKPIPPPAHPESPAPVKMTKAEEQQRKVVGTRSESAERVRQLRAKVRATKTKPRQKVTLDDSTYEFSSSVLVPRPATHKPHDPVYVISVDPKIIPSHDEIDKPEFITFLREFILAFSANPQNP